MVPAGELQLKKSFNFISSVGNSTLAVFARHTFESRQRLIFFSGFLSPIPLIANHLRESFLCFQFIQRLKYCVFYSTLHAVLLCDLRCSVSSLLQLKQWPLARSQENKQVYNFGLFTSKRKIFK